MGDGLVHLPAAGQDDAQVVVGVRVVGLDIQGLAVMGDGLVELSAAGQRQAEVVMGIRVVGLDFQGLAVMGDAPRRPVRGRTNARPRLDLGHPTIGVALRIVVR